MLLVGCTITKRKYTSGYYVRWHHKSSDTRPITQPKKPEPASNKIVGSNSSSEKTTVALSPENQYTHKLVQPISSTHNEKWLAKRLGDSFIPKTVSSSYTVAPENIPGHNQPENDTTKRDVRLSWLFCLLGILF
jgi:hypothetical protein